MLKSMTGYGKYICQLSNLNLVVEVKSLNSKNLDVFVKVPTFLREKEQVVRNLVGQLLVRGKVEVQFSVDIGQSTDFGFINRALFTRYYDEIKELTTELGISLPADVVNTVLRMPNVISAEDLPDEIEASFPKIQTAIVEACEKLDSHRVSEGSHLQADLGVRIINLHGLLQKVEPFEKERIDLLKSRLLKNLQELSGAGQPDPGRFEQELIYYLEKLDITEEKVRLAKHLQYFEETMNLEINPGKKLGFIAQEIGREVNTLGSKANHAEMQKLVIMMKDELEKIKEQLMNVL